MQFSGYSSIFLVVNSNILKRCILTIEIGTELSIVARQ